MDLKNQINTERLPRHIAVIMDGNGRWAKGKGRPRVFGHHSGVKSVREVTEAAAELGIEYLTLYAFSTENWGRPKFEVNALMTLLVNTIRTEIKTLMDNDVKLNAIGELGQLPSQCYKELLEAIEKTKDNKRMTLTLALNYSAKWEIIEAVKQIAIAVKSGDLEVENIENSTFDAALSTAGIPDPELMIRTSGETRISNFLLWQLAYAELYFTPVFWPDFDKQQFYKAILDFQNRERRFGKTSEQVVK
jgi:undecaprenyl diphosphate synthase